MKNQFVTYEIALKLKELGFDEKCLGYFGIQNELKIEIFYNSDPNLIRRNFISAPLWQQIIDWFREKHDLFISINKFGKKHAFRIESDGLSIVSNHYWNYNTTREQAILKAIELCKKN